LSFAPDTETTTATSSWCGPTTTAGMIAGGIGYTYGLTATQPLTQTAYAGSSVSFNVVATATGAPSYTWRYNGVPIPNFAPRFSGQNTATLTINPLGQPGSVPGWTDAGTYESFTLANELLRRSY